MTVTAPEAPAVKETVYDLTISTTTDTVIKGEDITLDMAIKNKGNDPLRSKTIKIYQHTKQTTQPQKGTPVHTAVTGGIFGGETNFKKATVTAPSVSQQKIYYYYLCVEDGCSKPVAVTVNITGQDTVPEVPEEKPEDKPSTSFPETPKCGHRPTRRIAMGGDAIWSQTVGETDMSTRLRDNYPRRHSNE